MTSVQALSPVCDSVMNERNLTALQFELSLDEQHRSSPTTTGDNTMNARTTLIMSAATFALLTTPASARIDADEGGASAYPLFKRERTWVSEFRYPSHYLVNRPFQQR
jgi:hypothetical protein